MLPFFTYQLSVSCHLLKRHSNQCEIYREVTVYTSCTCVLNQSLVSISNSDVMLFSNNDVILQSDGGRGQKGKKIAVILNVWPIVQMNWIAP